MSCHTDECWVTASECHIHPNLINPPAWPSHSVTSDLIANKWNQCDTHSPREVLFWAPVYVCHFSCLLMMRQLWGEVVARMNCLNVGTLPPISSLASCHLATYCLPCHLATYCLTCHLATLPPCHLATLATLPPIVFLLTHRRILRAPTWQGTQVMMREIYHFYYNWGQLGSDTI